jgi:hypothetical protein
MGTNRPMIASSALLTLVICAAAFGCRTREDGTLRLFYVNFDAITYFPITTDEIRKRPEYHFDNIPVRTQDDILRILRVECKPATFLSNQVRLLAQVDSAEIFVDARGVRKTSTSECALPERAMRELRAIMQELVGADARRRADGS